METKKNVQLSGRLPGVELNGLEPFYDELLVQGSDSQLIGIVVIEQDSWKVKRATGEPSAVAKIARIEIADTEEHVSILQTLLRELTGKRTGDLQLSLEGDFDE